MKDGYNIYSLQIGIDEFGDIDGEVFWRVVGEVGAETVCCWLGKDQLRKEGCKGIGSIGAWPGLIFAKGIRDGHGWNEERGECLVLGEGIVYEMETVALDFWKNLVWRY